MEGKPLNVRITGNISDPASIEILELETGAKLTNVIAVNIRLDTFAEGSLELVLSGQENVINLSGYANVRTIE